jgi:hypothetical protein
MRWPIFVELIGPDIRYAQAEHNIIANALSRLDIQVTREQINLTEMSFLGTDQVHVPIHTALYRKEQEKENDLLNKIQPTHQNI